MRFNTHSDLAGQHALLSASVYHWIRYDDEKFIKHFHTKMAAARGTELHDFASTCIKLKQKLPRIKKTLNMFVNDVLGLGLSSEQVVYVSPFSFGTADAIGFKNDRDGRSRLRVFDLKTGITRASFNQLEVYVAYFCLEYGFKPHEIDEIEMRIYQNNEVETKIADPEDILHIMNQTLRFNKIIEAILEEEAN